MWHILYNNIIQQMTVFREVSEIVKNFMCCWQVWCACSFAIIKFFALQAKNRKQCFSHSNASNKQVQDNTKQLPMTLGSKCMQGCGVDTAIHPCVFIKSNVKSLSVFYWDIVLLYAFCLKGLGGFLSEPNSNPMKTNRWLLPHHHLKSLLLLWLVSNASATFIFLKRKLGKHSLLCDMWLFGVPWKKKKRQKHETHILNLMQHMVSFTFSIEIHN